MVAAFRTYVAGGGDEEVENEEFEEHDSGFDVDDGGRSRIRTFNIT